MLRSKLKNLNKNKWELLLWTTVMRTAASTNDNVTFAWIYWEETNETSSKIWMKKGLFHCHVLQNYVGWKGKDCAQW